MSQSFILHNPRCSKSRQTLTLLQQHGEQPEIIEYLKTPPTPDELTRILQKLDLGPADLLRKKEAEYKALQLDIGDLTEPQLIELLCQHPKLIERPIFIKDNKARIGRPPESVLEII